MGGLRFPAFLLVLLYTTVVQIDGNVIEMGMFPEVADYSFQKCRKEMLQMVTKPGGLLETELNNSEDFKTMWQSNPTCKTAIPDITPKHMAALQSYAEASPTFHGNFKDLLQKSNGSAAYQDEFPFKSLFFLLTDAIQLLGKNECHTVYSGTVKEYGTSVGEKVHFKSFFPAKLQYTEATEITSLSDDIGTVFNITSCFVINLEDYECDSEKIELLISPTEVFTVTDIRIINNSNDKFKKITLNHFSSESSSKCTGLASFQPSSFRSSSLLSLMASLLMVYLYSLSP
ncbi:Ecto-ADP-ribosyltransferase 5 [Labeo rohita]|uniref:NAD(P)(+)--arginine ADP-ribosyltransferase n=3 Tax=Labeo rohita TaxID=84645 RepID=A0ABQ8LCH4_LABRO|nr:Ecto-ADP-ribosyltransferase 5 [Labeo rohita]